MHKLISSLLSLFPENKIHKLAELAVLKKQLRETNRKLDKYKKLDDYENEAKIKIIVLKDRTY